MRNASQNFSYRSLFAFVCSSVTTVISMELMRFLGSFAFLNVLSKKYFLSLIADSVCRFPMKILVLNHPVRVNPLCWIVVTSL